MKKVIGLFLVVLLSTVSVYAQKEKRSNRGGDPSQRMEKLITELKLDEKQAADFRKLNEEFREKMMKERENMDSDRQKMREKMTTMRDEMNTKVKKILTEEQYKLYQEKMEKQRPGNRKGGGRK